MKRTVKLIAALLTLVMLMSILPVTALADTNEGIGVPGEAAPAKTEVTVSAVCYNSNRTARIGTYSTKELSAKSITIDYETFGKYIKYNGRTYEFYTVKYNSKGHGSVVLADGKAHEVTVMYVPHTHKYTPRHDRIYHWDGCSCGKKLNVERHVNPATDDDSICTCGYQFSDNADLVTLWLSNMVLDTRFKPEITEYNAEIYTYKKVSSTQIKVRTFDALATVEKPTNLTVQDGLNVYQVTVTAEDCKTTKTYTVYAYRPVTVDGMDISTVRIEDEVASILAPKATSRKCIATYTLSETVAKAMAEQSKLNEGTQVILQPSFV